MSFLLFHRFKTATAQVLKTAREFKITGLFPTTSPANHSAAPHPIWQPLILLPLLWASYSAPAIAEQLPQLENLILHLDADRLAAENTSGSDKDLPALAAPLPNFEPKLLSVQGKSFIRFDGIDDHLRWEGALPSSESLTLAIAAVPHSNPGGFRGIFSLNEPGKRDYQSGFNLDLGPNPTNPLTALSVEGAGFSGFHNLQPEPLPFNTLHIFQVSIDPTKKKVRLVTNGKFAGERDYLPSSISLKSWTLGARFYSNDNAPQRAQGFFAGDVAELLVWNQSLDEADSEAIYQYLKNKHSVLAAHIAETVDSKIDSHYVHQKVPNPPAVQMLVPGFEVQELPVVLTNVNNVLYRRDGVLVTLGYNGDVHLLRDTDGDGVEDKASIFWKNTGSLRGPIGMIWTPEEYEHGQGVFVASKGKISAILDKDGDDVADEEKIISQGWNEIKQNVDAVGMALGADNYLYFGLGTADYANPYQVDETGKSAFSLESDRGTIQRVNLSTLARETFATGIRFPIGISFHPNGDLFCSDQEGATWLPNGNPFDELLFVEKGKHYGFPPRHPEHNPNVIDEPSVFDYGPQHQSTCGLWWNREIPGQWLFGSDLWKNDALVSGESRGKIWRTQVVKTPRGYQAMTQLIAGLQMLTIDSCVSPHGNLIVACHSGPPDWGTGPAGIGKLYRIAPISDSPAKPVMAWAQSETEFRIAFDKPLTEDAWRDLPRQLSIEYGDYVRAGDHYETLVPPYAVVQQQLVVPRHSLPVLGANITADRRTVLVQIPKTTRGTYYAVRWNLEGSDDPILTEEAKYAAATTMRSLDSPPRKPIDIPQRRDYAVDVNLNGLIATWVPTSGPERTVWLPHHELHVSRELTRGSAEHEAFFSALHGAGKLLLEAKLDAYQWLRPKIQPGSTLNFELPPESVVVTFRSNGDISLLTSTANPTDETNRANRLIKATAEEIQWKGDGLKDEITLDLSITTQDASALTTELFVSTNEDAKERIVPLTRILVPWSSQNGTTGELQLDNTKLAELQGGDWGRGRRVYHSAAAGCFKCHAINNVGPSIGPDLSNLVHRDYKSVMRDLTNPSYSINPDYLGHLVQMNDGSVLSGVLRTENGRLLLGDAMGVTHELKRDEIDEIKPSELSVMPTGLLENLTQEQIRDLMTFLLTPPPSMPLEPTLKAPPLRSKADALKVLEGSSQLPEPLRELKLVLVSGAKDHGPGEHDYPAWQKQWGTLLAGAANVHVEFAQDFPSENQMSAADVLIFFQKGAWNDQRATLLDNYLKRGGGAIYIHWAVNGDERSPDFSKRIGLASRGGHIKYRHGELNLELHNTDHPILRNLDQLDLLDESYWLLSGDPGKVTLLATSQEENAAWPQIWCYEQGAGKVFVSIPGHFSWTFDDPYFRTIILRAIAWSTNEPIDRFNELVLPGARVK